MAATFALTTGVVYVRSWTGTVSGASQTLSGDLTVSGNTNIGGAAGVRLTAANGILTMLGLGTGADENFLIDLNTTSNVIALSSGTSATTVNFSELIATVTKNGLGVTSTDGIVLTNTTAAAAGAQQMPPRIRLHGSGWKTDATAASQSVDMVMDLVPVQGASDPTGRIRWLSSINDGAYSEIMRLSSTGELSTAGGLRGTTLDLTGGVGGIVPSTGNAALSNAAFLFWLERTRLISPADGVLAILDSTDAAPSSLNYGTLAGTTSHRSKPKKVTAIADAVATTILTVTVPNANHAAAIKLHLLTSNGSTDAFESSRTAEGTVVLARITGADTVATAVAISDEAIATSGVNTHTLAYSVTAMTGAASATQTFDIQVTINDNGNTGGNQCVVFYELLNAEATGVTIA